MSPFWILVQLRMTELAVTTTAVTLAIMPQSNRHHPTNQHPAVLQGGCPSCHPTKAPKWKSITFPALAHPKLICGFPTLHWPLKAPDCLGDDCQSSGQPYNISTLSLHFNGHFPHEPELAGVYWSKGRRRWWWQLDYWSYKSCKAPVKLSPPTNQHSFFYRLDALPVDQPKCQSTEGKYHIPWTCLPRAHLGSSNFVHQYSNIINTQKQ